jgi:DNA polymerase-1
VHHPIVQEVLRYRSLTKLRSTYTSRLPENISPDTGRVHTSYQQAVTVTGRLSSSRPNLQNIPIRTGEGRRVRQAFIASEGCCIMAADYSQIELRIMAHLSEDQQLLADFAAGVDIHQATAAQVYGVTTDKVTAAQRRHAKAINFGLIYGMSAFGLAQQIGVARDAAQRMIDAYFTQYPGVREYMEATRSLAKEQGYVQTLFGRRMVVPEINSPQKIRQKAAERAAINAPMQGTAADIIKVAMVRVDAWLRAEGLRTQMIMQVHDELVFEVPAHEQAVMREALPGLMCGVVDLRVPLSVNIDVGENWDEAH